MTITGREPGSGRRAAAELRSLLPGLAVAAIGTAIAFAVNTLLPALSALTTAVVLGVLVGRFLPEPTRKGLDWTTKKLLRIGVVLLGLQLGLGDVLGLGLGTFLAVCATVLIAFFGTLALGNLLGVSRGLTLLVATGFSICGASAIAAVDSVTETDREDVATGITLVTLYGSAAIGLVPLIGSGLGLVPEQLGIWAGLSVHEVAQVVAAVSPAGAAAVGLAVVVKLTRVVLLAPVVAGVSVVERRRGRTGAGERPPLVPLFVVGFLLLMVVRSTGLVPDAVVSASSLLTTWLFAAALFGLGSGVRLGALLRTGRRGLALGGLSTVLVALVGLGVLAVTGA
ncbi:putative sulfate exporter family transporter [Salinifilum aidingensis]